MHCFFFDCWIRHNHHDEGRLRELFYYRCKSLILDHQRLERIIRLNAAQLELLYNIRYFLESVTIYMPLHVSMRYH